MRRRTFLTSPFAVGIANLATPSFADDLPQVDLGHLLISGFRGTEASDPEVDQVRRYIEDGTIAGVLLLKRNIRSPDQLERLTTVLREASPDRPPIISIDQEGGAVARLGPNNGFSEWMSAANLAYLDLGDDEILEYYRLRAQEMAAVGINLNYGPVVDLNVNPNNPIIGSLGRSYGERTETVVRFAEIFVRAHRLAGVRTCLKHFPGHGSSMTDSHMSVADVSDTWSAAEIIPFQHLTNAGFADAIMNSHVLHPFLSDEPWVPASLSRRSSRAISEMNGFRGLIITDDMQMGAITNLVGATDAAVAAVNAGNSLLIYSNYKKSHSIRTAATIASALKAAVDEGRIDIRAASDHIARVREFRGFL